MGTISLTHTQPCHSFSQEKLFLQAISLVCQIYDSKMKLQKKKEISTSSSAQRDAIPSVFQGLPKPTKILMSLSARLCTEEVPCSNGPRVCEMVKGSGQRPQYSCRLRLGSVFDHPLFGWSNYDGNKSSTTYVNAETWTLGTGLFYWFALEKLTLEKEFFFFTSWGPKLSSV